MLRVSVTTSTELPAAGGRTHAVLLVCPCREHHDDSDGVHGERSAGLFPQGECCGAGGNRRALSPARLQQASLSSGFSSSLSIYFFAETRGTVHIHPAHHHVAGDCLWHEVPGRDGLHP